MTMKKLGVLVWRDWRISRKTYQSGMFAGAVLVSFFWLIRLSMSVGNLAPIFEGSELLTEFSGLIYYMSTSMVAVVATALATDMTTVAADIRANWMRYSFALPVSPWLRSASMYTVKLIRIGIGFAVSMINGMVTAKITGVPFTGHMVWFFLTCIAAAMLYDVLLTAFCSKARTIGGLQKQQAKAMGVLMAPALIYMFHKMSSTDSGTDESLDDMINRLRDLFISHENIIIPLTVAVLIAAPLLGWFICALHYRTHGDAREDAQPKKLFSRSRKEETEGGTEA